MLPQRPGKGDAPVRPLALLEDGHQGPARREARAVQGVDELGLGPARRAVADSRPPGLEVPKIAARGDLPVGVLGGEPDLQVVGLGGGEAEVPGAERYRPVVEPQELEHPLGVGGERFELLLARLGPGELHQLHLVELVLADEPARVLSVGARLAPEAGGAGGVLQGKVRRLEDLPRMDVRDGDLAGGNEVVRAFVHPEEFRFELGELARPRHGPAVHHEGGEPFGVAVLPRVKIEHEVNEGALEPGPRAAEEGEACPPRS